MIEPHDKLSITQQCQLLGLPRSIYYYQPQPFNDEELALLRLMSPTCRWRKVLLIWWSLWTGIPARC